MGLHNKIVKCLLHAENFKAFKWTFQFFKDIRFYYKKWFKHEMQKILFNLFDVSDTEVILQISFMSPKNSILT